jgi:ERCC4-related helicase
MPTPGKQRNAQREGRATRLAEQEAVVLLRVNPSSQATFHRTANPTHTVCGRSLARIQPVHPMTKASSGRVCVICYQDPIATAARIQGWLTANPR